jgi:hypothetical protein
MKQVPGLLRSPGGSLCGRPRFSHTQPRAIDPEPARALATVKAHWQHPAPCIHGPTPSSPPPACPRPSPSPYINPKANGRQIILVARIVVIAYGLLSGVLAIALLKIGLSLGWVRAWTPKAGQAGGGQSSACGTD